MVVVGVGRDQQHVCVQDRHNGSSFSFQGDCMSWCPWRLESGQLTEKFGFPLRHDLVVDVEAALARLLEYHSGFFQKICGVIDKRIVCVRMRGEEHDKPCENFVIHTLLQSINV